MAARSSARLRVVDDDSYAQLSDVKQFASELPDKYLHCRDLGHNWMPFQAGAYRDGGYLVVHRCSRCRTKRRRDLSPSGIPLRSNYEHPDGYLTEGIGRIVGEGRGLLRLESVQRLIPSDAGFIDDEENEPKPTRRSRRG